MRRVNPSILNGAGSDPAPGGMAKPWKSDGKGRGGQVVIDSPGSTPGAKHPWRQGRRGASSLSRRNNRIQQKVNDVLDDLEEDREERYNASPREPRCLEEDLNAIARGETGA